MGKPDAPATQKNRDPILGVLQRHFADRRCVLEIGSGTGQHAVYFAAALPHLNWQCSDRSANLPGISLWLADMALPNTPPAFALDVNAPPPAPARYDAVFSANTLHIMSWAEVAKLFALLPDFLEPGALLTIYGPFNVGGRFTSESNARFDASLKAEDPLRGIRDRDEVDALARRIGLRLIEDAEMPVNNRCLTWRLE